MIGVAFGYFAIQSVLGLLQVDGGPLFAAAPLRHLIGYQLVLLFLIFTLLRTRGWRLRDLGERPHLIDVPLGVPLAIVAYLPFPLLWWLLMDQPSDFTVGDPVSLDLSGLDLKTIFAGALVNSVYEEILVVGYLMTALRKQFSAAVAIHISVLIRLSYHLQLGIVALRSILPLGYVFAYWYSRQRSLLPVIAAHTILDVIGFTLYRVA